MKKILFSLIAVLAAVAFAATPGDVPALRSATPIVIPSPASILNDPTGYMYTEKLFDDTLALGNSTKSGPIIDIRNLAVDRYAYKDTIMVTDSIIGTAAVSCYDVNDSAAVTDSVSVKAWVLGYDYASDNINPLSRFGPTAFLAGDSTGVLAAASASNARKDSTFKFVLKTQVAKSTPYLQVVFRNISTAAQNIPRCRFYLIRKRAKVGSR
jgi:hypothetical protein